MIEDIILYIVWELRNNKQHNSITRLMKLLYLMDLISIKKYDQKLTPFNYDYEAFGPVIHGFGGVMQEFVEKDLIKDNIKITKFGEAHDYRPNKKYNVKLDLLKEYLIDDILRLYGEMDLTKLVDIVYSTNPMKKHAPGDLLL